MTTRLTREESRQRTREAILDAAERTFGEQGYRGASLDGIALAAGYSKGAVYSNFESKAALFLELMDRRAEREEQALDGRAVPDPGDGWALATLDFFIDAVRDQDIRSALAQRYEQARSRLGAMIASGSPESDWATQEEVASVAMALGSGLVIQSVIEPGSIAPDLFGRTMTRLLSGGTS